MYTRSEIQVIVLELRDRLQTLFPGESFEIIVFGSCARNEAADGSDIDVLFLVNAPRKDIAQKNWQIGEAAAEVLMKHGVVVSPIVENHDYFQRHVNLLPFYKNIQREGVRISA